MSGSVTVSGNTAMVTLTANVTGTFKCKLDDGVFETCMYMCVCVCLSVCLSVSVCVDKQSYV